MTEKGAAAVHAGWGGHRCCTWLLFIKKAIETSFRFQQYSGISQPLFILNKSFKVKKEDEKDGKININQSQ